MDNGRCKVIHPNISYELYLPSEQHDWRPSRGWYPTWCSAWWKVRARPSTITLRRFVGCCLMLMVDVLYIFARNSPQNSYESSLGPFRKNIKYTSIVMLELASLFKHFYRRHVFLHFDLCRTYSGAYILSFFLENSHREVSLCSTTTTRKWKLSNSAQHDCLVQLVHTNI